MKSAMFEMPPMFGSTPKGLRAPQSWGEDVSTSHALLIGAILDVLYASADKTLRGVANFLPDLRIVDRLRGLVVLLELLQSSAGVPVEPAFRLYRDTGVVISHKGEPVLRAQAFVDHLKSDPRRRIFSR